MAVKGSPLCWALDPIHINYEVKKEECSVHGNLISAIKSRIYMMHHTCQYTTCPRKEINLKRWKMTHSMCSHLGCVCVCVCVRACRFRQWGKHSWHKHIPLHMHALSFCLLFGGSQILLSLACSSAVLFGALLKCYLHELHLWKDKGL